jgi:hypothetical protein
LRGVSTPLLDETTRAQMASHLDGWLGVWPQRGVCYRARLVPADETLPLLLRLLSDVAARTS